MPTEDPPPFEPSETYTGQEGYVPEPPPDWMVAKGDVPQDEAWGYVPEMVRPVTPSGEESARVPFPQLPDQERGYVPEPARMLPHEPLQAEPTEPAPIAQQPPPPISTEQPPQASQPSPEAPAEQSDT
jgi:hypothetical protein